MYDKRVGWIYSFIDTVLSIIRIFQYSRFKKTNRIERNSDRCIIMGNGPSLINTLKENKSNLSKLDLVAVNFMGLSPEYIEYKPNVYVLCDPGFWLENVDKDLEEKVISFYRHIAEKTTWNLQLYLPYRARKVKRIENILSPNKNVTLNYYNKTKFEGYKCLKYWFYDKQWGMSRTQNVLVAALILAIYSEYKEIYLAGADSDWIKHLWIDEKNNLRINDYHYYKDSPKNIERVLSLKMHEQLTALYFAFKSYVEIENYSVYRKIKIYNTGLNSFIDAFEKKEMICK